MTTHHLRRTTISNLQNQSQTNSASLKKRLSLQWRKQWRKIRDLFHQEGRVSLVTSWLRVQNLAGIVVIEEGRRAAGPRQVRVGERRNPKWTYNRPGQTQRNLGRKSSQRRKRTSSPPMPMEAKHNVIVETLLPKCSPHSSIGLLLLWRRRRNILMSIPHCRRTRWIFRLKVEQPHSSKTGYPNEAKHLRRRALSLATDKLGQDLKWVNSEIPQQGQKSTFDM